MNRHDLYESIGTLDEEILNRSEKNKGKKRKGWRWLSAIAAMLVLVIGTSAIFEWNRQRVNNQPGKVEEDSVALKTYAIAEASYPKMAPYPEEELFVNLVEDSEAWELAYENWFASVEAQKREDGYADGLESFWKSSIREFLSGGKGENRAYSPVNVYMALGMLAELTDGNSRKQILDVMHAESIESLRTQANAVWNAQYRDDGATTSILASSLWLNENISFVSDTLKLLKENYYASSYQGKMGSKKFNQALQTWLNEQTGGLLKEQIDGVGMEPETVLALATTIYYRAKWDSEFHPLNTKEDIFYTGTEEITCDFMHSNWQDTYYWGEQFGAVGKRLENDGGTMWFLLPDEGVSVEELVQSEEAMDFLLKNGAWENQKYLVVNLAVPKFDASSQIELTKGLQSLGITDVFDRTVSDFTPMTTEVEDVFLSDALHGVRVSIDEEGVEAAAYTVMKDAGAAMPPEEEINFILNRPFLFAITSNDGLPLFVGVVNQPN